MRRIDAALPQTLRALGIARRTREAQALYCWPEVLGELSRETRALKLTGGTLWVTASSTALAHQLHLERGQLLQRLNQLIGAPVVHEIRFRQGDPRR
jgi:hypothetical protein